MTKKDRSDEIKTRHYTIALNKSRVVFPKESFQKRSTSNNNQLIYKYMYICDNQINQPVINQNA